MILLIFGVSLAVLFFLVLLACFLSWADQQFGSSVSAHSESSEAVSGMELAEAARLSPPPSYSSNSGVPIINSQVVIGKSLSVFNLCFF